MRGHHTDNIIRSHRNHRKHGNILVGSVGGNYIHNRRNGKRNGKTEMDTSMHKIAKTKEPKDQKDLMFNL